MKNPHSDREVAAAVEKAAAATATAAAAETAKAAAAAVWEAREVGVA